MPHYRAIRRRMIGAGLALALLPALPAAAQSNGNARLDARYVVTLAGLKLGEGTWLVDVSDTGFSAEANGGTSGLARIVSSGTGITTVRGGVKGGQLIPATYAVAMKWGKRFEDLTLKFADGGIKEVSIVPTPPPTPNRVPVTEAHRRNVLDPMTGSLLRVPGKGDLMAPETCDQQKPVFDGRMRYDLSFAYKRTEQVKVPGYAGPALVCAIHFTPLSGYVPTRAAIKYLQARRDMEIWLVPIAGTRIMVPVRVVIPTPFGQGVLQATQLYSLPLPGRASAKTN